MSLHYRIVYPRGMRTELTVAQVYDWEEGEWDIASSKRFDDRGEAEEHMQHLASKHSLNCKPRPTQLLD